MITITGPHDGWIELILKDTDGQILEIDFSDVGPDTVGMLREVAEKEGGSESTIVQFNLEPAQGGLRFEYDGSGGLKVVGTVHFDGVMLHYVATEFIAELRKELAKLDNKCPGPSWG